MHECSPSATPPLDLPLPHSARLRRIAEHLAGRASDRVSHATLARRFGIGVRTLVNANRGPGGLGPAITLRAPRPHVLRVLQLTGVDQIFRIED